MWGERWSCRYTEPAGVRYCGCDTLDSALAKKAEWEAQIAAARADGWA